MGRANIKDCWEKLGVMGMKAGFGWCQSCLGKAGWIGVGIKDLWEEMAGVDNKDL